MVKLGLSGLTRTATSRRSASRQTFCTLRRRYADAASNRPTAVDVRDDAGHPPVRGTDGEHLPRRQAATTDPERIGLRYRVGAGAWRDAPGRWPGAGCRGRVC